MIPFLFTPHSRLFTQLPSASFTAAPHALIHSLSFDSTQLAPFFSISFTFLTLAPRLSSYSRQPSSHNSPTSLISLSPSVPQTPLLMYRYFTLILLLLLLLPFLVQLLPASAPQFNMYFLHVFSTLFASVIFAVRVSLPPLSCGGREGASQGGASPKLLAFIAWG